MARKKPAGRHHHGDLPRALIEVTLAIVEARGVEALTIRDVAQRLRVSEAALYYHYDGKAGLLVAIATEGYAEMHASMRAAIDAASDDPLEQLAALGRAYVEHALRRPGHFRVMFGQHMIALAAAAPLRHEAHATALLLAEVATRCARATGRRVPSPKLIERTAWALVHGLAWLVLEQEVRLEPGERVESLIDQALAILTRGIRALADEPRVPVTR